MKMYMDLPSTIILLGVVGSSFVAHAQPLSSKGAVHKFSRRDVCPRIIQLGGGYGIINSENIPERMKLPRDKGLMIMPQRDRNMVQLFDRLFKQVASCVQSGKSIESPPWSDPEVTCTNKYSLAIKNLLSTPLWETPTRQEWQICVTKEWEAYEAALKLKEIDAPADEEKEPLTFEEKIKQAREEFLKKEEEQLIFPASYFEAAEAGEKPKEEDCIDAAGEDYDPDMERPRAGLEQYKNRQVYGSSKDKNKAYKEECNIF